MFILRAKRDCIPGKINTLHMEMIRRQDNRRYVVYICCNLILAAIILAFPFCFAKLTGSQSSNYLISSDSVRNLIIDKDMLLNTDERKELIEAAETTAGQYYQIKYLTLNEETNEDLFDAVHSQLSSGANPARVVIVHNMADNKYYLWPSSALITKTPAFNLIEYDVNKQITEQFFLKTNEAYSNILTGTPAQVYTKVFNYITENGFGADIQKTIKSFVNENNIGLVFLGALLDIPFALIVLSIGGVIYENYIADNIFPQKCGWLDTAIVNYFVKKREKEQQREKEKEILLQKQKEAKEQLERAQYEKLHATIGLVEALKAFNCDNEEIQNKKVILLEKLNVLDNLIASGRASIADISFYLDTFTKGLSDINKYSWAHHTKMDTPEEIAIINETFDVFLEIITSFNQKYEESDVSNIAITLNVLRQKAALDGLVKKDFNTISH